MLACLASCRFEFLFSAVASAPSSLRGHKHFLDFLSSALCFSRVLDPGSRASLARGPESFHGLTKSALQSRGRPLCLWFYSSFWAKTHFAAHQLADTNGHKIYLHILSFFTNLSKEFMAQSVCLSNLSNCLVWIVLYGTGTVQIDGNLNSLSSRDIIELPALGSSPVAAAAGWRGAPRLRGAP